MNLIERKAREYLIKKTIADVEKRIVKLNDISLNHTSLNLFNTGILINLNSANRLFLENLRKLLEKELKKLKRKNL